MKFVRQRNHNDCGLATAAMLAGRTYRDALQADPCPEKHCGLTLAELRETVQKLTGNKTSVRAPRNATLENCALPNDCAVIINRPGDLDCHWIAYSNGNVYDPEYCRQMRLKNYEHKHWRVVRVVTCQP
jgi:ABC-type bacteriocin/lantibiotic exporter with double-glycine peptidase domain